MRRLLHNPSVSLGFGALLLVLSQMRFGLGILAWIAPVFWLHFVRRTVGWRPKAALLGVGWIAWVVAVAKIITDPIPVAMALAFGTPVAIVLVAPFFASGFLRRRLGENAATLGFAALMVVAEWSLHGLMPIGVWGAAANTQLDQLALLQLASITGLHGVSFLIYLVAAVLERALTGERSSLRVPALITAGLLLGTLAFGQARLAVSSGTAHQTRLVAAIGTDSLIGTTPALPTASERAAVQQRLFERTERAAIAGAELVVWTEASTMVYPDEEAAWQTRLGTLSRRLGVNIVAAYIVPLSEEPLRYENKYVFSRADGALDHIYFKHEPVPGEPAVRGDAPMPRVILDDGSVVGGAICYDYDFPRLALANARLGVDLVALPSSDWRGIDPMHTQMAALRAIEGGYSVLRATRFGLSAGIDAWGRIRGWNSHWDNETRVLLVELPRRGVATIYARLGDWWPLSCALICVALFGVALRRRR